MNVTAILRSQTRYNFLASLRAGSTVAIGIVMPVLFYIGFSAIFSGDGFAGEGTIELRDSSDLASLKVQFTGAFMAYGIIYGAFASLLPELVNLRETGALKRLRGTPLPLWTFVAARFVIALLLAVVAVAVIALFGHFVYDTELRAAGIIGVIVYTFAGTLTFACLSFAATSVTKSENSAQALSNGFAIVLAMVSGIFFDPGLLPDFVNTIAKFFPLEPLAHGFKAIYANGANGTGLNLRDLAVIAAWGAAGLLITLRFFRWDPQQRR